MRLWTIQTPTAVTQLERTGALRSSRQHIDEDYLRPYRWMREQMRSRISRGPSRAWPIWAWQQWEGQARAMPDLRAAGHLPSGTVGVRLELEVEPDNVLLSDFELWHYVLNYWYLPTSISEGTRFERELRSKGPCFFRSKPLPDTEYHEKIVESWGKIFDLDWAQRDIAYPRKKKSIQACMWQIELEMVRGKREFKAR
ncbi:MAG: DUF3841 domain-containing protein [bacterium]|nr:DUF3841 domain-containing protein [bacterium]